MAALSCSHAVTVECRCKEATEAASSASAMAKPAAQSAAASARRLGLHYLTRYFFLITFQVCIYTMSCRRWWCLCFAEGWRCLVQLVVLLEFERSSGIVSLVALALLARLVQFLVLEVC